MKQSKFNLMVILVGAAIIALTLSSCFSASKLADLSGAELWADNCSRCHNVPPPSTFTADQWEVITLHMKTRALITDEEITKIQAFLKDSS